MTYSTDVLLYVGYSGDKGLQPFLEALMKNDDRYGATLLPLDTDAANGPRAFGGAVLAAGANYFPTWDMQELLDGVRWSCPGDVVLICATEDKITEVLRPTFVEEYGGHWNSEVRAVQPAGGRNTVRADADKIAAALDIANALAGNEGRHHETYCIDQMVRALTGCPQVEKTALDWRQQPYTDETMGESAEYEAFVARYAGEWEIGIAP